MTWSYKYRMKRDAALFDLADPRAGVDRDRVAELLDALGEFEMPERDFGRPGWQRAVEAAREAVGGARVAWA